jgi:hypothetical protein
MLEAGTAVAGLGSHSDHVRLAITVWSDPGLAYPYHHEMWRRDNNLYFPSRTHRNGHVQAADSPQARQMAFGLLENLGQRNAGILRG